MQGKTSNRIEEIFHQLAESFQSTSRPKYSVGLSPLRRKSLAIFQKLETLSDKYVKHQTMKTMVMTIVRPHITKVITHDIPEAELKQVMSEIFQMLKEDFDDFEIAAVLKDDKLNSPEMTAALMKLPQYSEIAKLL